MPFVLVGMLRVRDPRMVWLKFHGLGPDAVRIRDAAARKGVL